MKHTNRASIIGLLCTLYFIVLFIIMAVYHEWNSRQQEVSLTADIANGEVTFRGVSLDGKWYNPNDLIVSGRDNWQENVDEMTYTAVDKSPLTLRLPKGEVCSITFNSGPDTGSVDIGVYHQVIKIDTRADHELEFGQAYDLPVVPIFENADYILNRNALIGFIVMFGIMSLVIVCMMKGKAKAAQANHNKNGAIEFMRFVMILGVCIHHYCGLMPGGYLGVDFFFILSGFLLMQHFEAGAQGDVPVREAFHYTKKRYFRLFPYYICAFMCAWMIQALLNKGWTIVEFLRDSVWELLMLESFGMTENLVIGPGWYCSALLIAGFFVYYFLCRHKIMYLYGIAPVSLFLFFAWMSRNFGTLNRWTQYDTVICTGTIRGFAELGLGCICYQLCSTYKNSIHQMKYNRMVSAIIEFGCVVYIYYVERFKGESYEDFICVIVMAVLITSLFCGNSMISGLFNNKLAKYLGASCII